VDSLTGQTLREIEIILVDDYSTDGTRDILKTYGTQDKRIKTFFLECNTSAFQARKKGVETASGKYIMFVDADDFLDPEACEKLWELERESPVDILHFGTNVITDSMKKEKIESYKELINPREEWLSGEEIFRAFTNRKFEGHLWNKIFKRDLCLLALSKAGNNILPKGQDKYFYWIMAFYAQSYRGCPFHVLYNYNYGMGVEGAAKRRDLRMFEIFCKQSWTENAIERFMAENTNISLYEEVIRSSRRNLLRHCVKNWRMLEKEAQAEGLHMMIHYWCREGDRGELVGALGDAFRNNQEELIETAKRYRKQYPGRKRIPHTIGTYYHILNNGGIQRVISKLMGIWIQCGYEVVLFTDYENENDYELPEGVVRVIVEKSGRAASENYVDRGISLEHLMREYHIDTMVYHDYFGESILWDLLLCTFMEVSFIIYYHNIFTKYMIFQNEKFYKLPELAPLSDGMAVLSDTDKMFWDHYNANVHKVTNPLSFHLNEIHQSVLKYKNIVWVGRLDEIQKRFNEPVTIMKKVIQEIPDAKLFIVGKDDSGINFERLQNRIKKLKLENTVILCGFQKQVEPFYEMASVHLMTSTHEGSPMALIEALSYGIPTVMYELPYLEVVKDNKGIRAVKQGDSEAAAAEICRLLSDTSRRMEMGRQARQYIENFYAAVDIGQEWSGLFASASEYKILHMEGGEKILFDTILLHYRFSLEFYPKASLQKQLDETNRKLEELQSENEILKQEYGYLMAGFEGMKHGWSMKIGSLVTWPLRKLRDFVRKGR